MTIPQSPDVVGTSSTSEYDPSVQDTTGETDSTSLNPKTYLATFFVMNSVSKTNQKLIQQYVEQVQKEAQAQTEYRKEDDLKRDILKAVRRLNDSPEKRKLIDVLMPDRFPLVSTDSLERMH